MRESALHPLSQSFYFVMKFLRDACNYVFNMFQMLNNIFAFAWYLFNYVESEHVLLYVNICMIIEKIQIWVILIVIIESVGLLYFNK